jgi:hypothetical protein
MTAMTTPRQRDHGLHRVSRVTRWFAVGAAAATGIFAFLLARPVASAPTQTDSAPAGDGTSTGAATANPLPGSSGSGSSASSSGKRTTPNSQLKSPTTVPQRSSRRARASSGGS